MVRNLVVLLLCIQNAICVAGAESVKPNVIFILADDLGFGDLSCQGQTYFKTPNIDALAKRGMRFTQSYSGSTVCAPSRCSLLTGMHTGHSAVRGNAERMPEGQLPMPEGTFTVADLLKTAGYTTGVFGKWGLGYPGSASDPLNVGFDRFYGYNCQRMAHSYYPYFLWDNDRRDILWNNFGLQRGDYAPDFIHKATLDFIRENKDRPFFCYYALVQPHAEMLAPEKYMKKYRGRFLPEKSYEANGDSAQFRRMEYASQSEAHAAFAAMVNVLDDYVGEVMVELDELGIADNTLVIFSSDNGPHVEGGADPDYFNSNGVYKGYKRDLYEGGIHVPFIAAWPGKIAAGSVTDHLFAFWDFLPTMAELTGIPLANDVDGISCLPTLLGKPEQKEHGCLYWEFPAKDGRVAVRKGKWKAVRYNVREVPDSLLELYDLSKDPGETENLVEEYPEIVAELNRLILFSHTDSLNPDWNLTLKGKE